MKRKILFGILMILFLFVINWVYQQDLMHESIVQNHPLVIAHRGASGHAPENTLSAVQIALDYKVDLVEIDVHLSQDGKIVVIHDASLDRTTNGSGPVDAYSLMELKELDAGSWFGVEFREEKIPTLQEVFELVSAKAIILIEIKKGEIERYEGIEKKVVDLIRTYHAESWTIIQSFQEETVSEVIRIAPELEIHKLIIGELPGGWNHDGQWRFQSATLMEGVGAVNCFSTFGSKRMIRQIHESGKKIFVYTINEEEEMRRYMNLGVDGIITDYPDRLIALIKQR